MPIEPDDIKINEDALGVGKSIRFTGTGGASIVVSEDVEFPNIKIVTINSSGGGGGGTGTGYFPGGW